MRSYSFFISLFSSFPSHNSLFDISWQKISDPESIGDILRQVYADHTTNVDDVFCRIVETTQHPAAAASFASIMFAPQGKLSFWEALSRWDIILPLRFNFVALENFIVLVLFWLKFLSLFCIDAMRIQYQFV